MPYPHTPTLRTATLADAHLLAQLAESTFRETFSADNSPADMDKHCQISYGEAMQAREILSPTMLTLVAEEGAALVAFAQLRWEKAPACVSARAPGEIERFYVDKRWHGKGLAQALMTLSLDSLRARGSDVAWLGVWEHNPRAIRFYQKFGFEPVGEHSFMLGDDEQHDRVMTRAL